jgi:hypothetical protein
MVNDHQVLTWADPIGFEIRDAFLNRAMELSLDSVKFSGSLAGGF